MREKAPHKIIVQKIEGSEAGAERLAKIGKIVANLEGVTLDKTQQYGIATIGSAMNIYDAAFDTFDITKSQSNGKAMLKMIDGVDDNDHGMSPELGKALILAKENLNPAALHVFKDLTLAQIESIKQREGTMSLESLEDLSKRKGGKTALLLALEINPAMDEKRQQCYEELGYLLQLVDDFADRELDKKEGIITLAHIIKNPEMVATILGQNKKVRELFTSHYEPYKLTEIFSYMDKLLASVGI